MIALQYAAPSTTNVSDGINPVSMSRIVASLIKGDFEEFAMQTDDPFWAPQMPNAHTR